MSTVKKLEYEFFHRDCLDVAPDLVGKIIVRKSEDGEILRLRITETEAYRGEEDTACHASRGRTPRTEMLYSDAGVLYVYLCYGIHWMMNVITGEKDAPQGVLFRACEKIYDGPGKLTKYLKIGRSFNGLPVYKSDIIWLEDDGYRPETEALPRVGINYATPEYRDILWRFKDKYNTYS